MQLISPDNHAPGFCVFVRTCISGGRGLSATVIQPESSFATHHFASHCRPNMAFLQEKRPSRMINLNKSPRDQKIMYVCLLWAHHVICVNGSASYSAVYNAENSPFLLLPPELRSRIYDFVFGDLVIRRLPWRNTVCQKHQACEVERRQRYDQKISYYPTPDQIHPSHLKEDLGLTSCTTQKQARIPVRLLQVCRQINHEAALKPFSEPTFVTRIVACPTGRVALRQGWFRRRSRLSLTYVSWTTSISA